MNDAFAAAGIEYGDDEIIISGWIAVDVVTEKIVREGDEVEDMQWMLLADRAVASEQERIEQTMEVLDAFDELDLPADEMEEIWLEELDWLEEELDSESSNA